MELQFKTDKTTRILILYHQLLNGQFVDKATFSLEHGINERTFDRDIEDVRLFLSEIFSTSELLFDKDTCAYYLTGTKPKCLDRMDATVIGKILLSSSALREDEMIGLLHALLSAAAPNDARAVQTYLQQSTDHYISKTEAALLKTLGDLYAAIHNGTDIEVVLEEDTEPVIKKLSPLEIEMIDSAFYLIAAENNSLSSIVCCPVDKIRQFQTLHSTFALTLQEKYRNKETKDHG